VSCGSAWLHCAKTAEQIKILFGANTLEGPRNVVLDGGDDPPRRGGGDLIFEFWATLVFPEQLKLET